MFPFVFAQKKPFPIPISWLIFSSLMFMYQFFVFPVALMVMAIMALIQQEVDDNECWQNFKDPQIYIVIVFVFACLTLLFGVCAMFCISPRSTRRYDNIVAILRGCGMLAGIVNLYVGIFEIGTLVESTKPDSCDTLQIFLILFSSQIICVPLNCYWLCR